MRNRTCNRCREIIEAAGGGCARSGGSFAILRVGYFSNKATAWS